jgi:hypothetical protein
MPMIAGGCLCGAVRYRSQAEPVMQVICHCKTCQKNSGSAFSMNVAVPQDTLELDGDEPRRYEDRSGSSGQPFLPSILRVVRLARLQPRRSLWRAGGYEVDGYFAALGLQARLRPDGERRVVEACRTTFGKRP